MFESLAIVYSIRSFCQFAKDKKNSLLEFKIQVQKNNVIP